MILQCACNPLTLFGWKPALHAAASGNDAKKIVKLLHDGKDVNALHYDFLICGSSALHHAAAHGSVDAAKILIENGANIDIVNSFGDTPLHIAAGIMPHYSCDLRITHEGDGSYEIVRLLIERGATPTILNNNGNAPIHNAALHGRYEIIKFLIENGVQVDAENSRKATPFILCGNNHISGKDPAINTVTIARFLIHAGANTQRITADRYTALHLASVAGNTDHMIFLLQLGQAIDAQNEDGDTPLHVAAMNCQSDAITKLLEHGAKSELSNNKGMKPRDLVMLHCQTMGDLSTIFDK